MNTRFDRTSLGAPTCQGEPARTDVQNVLVAEPHWLVRQGLVAVIDKIDGCRVVAEAGTGAQALAAAQQLQPGLVLLGLGIAEPGCVDVVTNLRQHGAAPKVLVLSQPDAEASARDALRAGCDGFIDMQQGGESLAQAIHEVLAGRPFFDPQLARRLLLGVDEPAAGSHDVLAVLTQRERAVFVHIAAGHTNRSAGAALHISEKTVEKHRALVMQKLALRSAVELRMLAGDLRSRERQAPNAPRLTPANPNQRARAT